MGQLLRQQHWLVCNTLLVSTLARVAPIETFCACALGPLCEVCPDGFIKRDDGVCVVCTASEDNTFFWFAGVLVGLFGAVPIFAHDSPGTPHLVWTTSRFMS